ncbi:hypothetical protein [Kineococcus glutinatus]|uniref:Glycerophosphoryl diester phosphodiesterase family protein n=1 Tax=Kineococcus glutinatus TaxID=1070872 RepID=A0ABP8VG02_9ACTN
MGEGTQEPPPPGSGGPWQQPGTGPAPQWASPQQHAGAPAPPPPGWGPAAAARPGIVPLRPLGLGEIYDGAFRAFRQNPPVMVGLSAIVVALSTLLTLVPTALLTSDLAELGAAGEVSTDAVVDQLASIASRSVPAFVVTVALQSIATTVLNGLLIVAVSRAVLGERIGLGALWGLARGRVLPLVALAVFLVLPGLLLALLAVGPGIALIAAGSAGAGVAVLVVSTLAAIAVGAWLYVRWSLAAPALLLERAGVLGSMGRSWRLVRGSTWRVLGITLLTWLIAYAVITALAVPFSVLAGVVTGVLSASGAEPTTGTVVLQQAIGSVGSTVANTVALPFVASVTALLYIDLRMRREGLDVELHRAAAGGPPEQG